MFLPNMFLDIIIRFVVTVTYEAFIMVIFPSMIVDVIIGEALPMFFTTFTLFIAMAVPGSS